GGRRLKAAPVHLGEWGPPWTRAATRPRWGAGATRLTPGIPRLEWHPSFDNLPGRRASSRVLKNDRSAVDERDWLRGGCDTVSTTRVSPKSAGFPPPMAPFKAGLVASGRERAQIGHSDQVVGGAGELGPELVALEAGVAE